MHVKNQQGSVLIYCLLFLSFTAVIGFTMHSLAYMEINMSLYEHRANQARELAEAASIITMEELCLLLNNEYCEIQQLPQTITLENHLPTMFSEDKILQTGTITKVGQNNSLCIYSFTSSGIFQGARKTINLHIGFDYVEHYDYEEDSEGNVQEIFRYREFTNRGRVISFSEV